MTLIQLFTAIANAIRAKKGTSETIKAENFPTEIASITTGVDTSDANAEPINIRKDKTAYVNGEKITGTLPVLTYPINPDNPSDFDYQFIEANTVKSTTRNNTTYIMEAYQIAGNNEPDSWMFEGNRKMKLGIAQSKVASAISLKGEQIKKGEKVLGVTGTYEGEGSSEYNAKVYTGTVSTALTSYPSIRCWIKEVPPVDLTGFTTCSNFFSNCYNLEKISGELNTSNITNMDYMFQQCKKIKTIPNMNTSKVTTYKYFCQDCQLLENVPILDTHLASPYSMNQMFTNCPNLTNESLNNILYMCANVGSGSAYRKLAYIGLSSEQATTCTGLSNWASAQAAGWTTGY